MVERRLVDMLQRQGVHSSLALPISDDTVLVFVLLRRPTATSIRMELRRHLTSGTSGNGHIIKVLLVLVEKASNLDQHLHKLQDELQVRLQVFLLHDLQFNISHHVLVPRHTRVSDAAEVQRVLRTYHLKNKHQLPLILHSDPMARYLDLQPGDVVRIERNSPSSGSYVVFRCCV